MKLKLRYQEPPPDERGLKRVARRLTSRPTPKFPKDILLETQSGCNAKCVFCVYEKFKDKVPKGRMTDELFERILDECARHGLRRLSPFFTNEPLMDKGMVDRLRVIKSKLPGSKVVLTTNASLLKPETSRQIVDLGCLHSLYVSFQTIDKEAYEETMPGLKFERTLENVEYFIDYLKKSGRTRPKVVVTMVRTSVTEPHVQRSMDYWKSKGVEAQATELETRGGEVDEAQHLASKRLKRMRYCARPFKQAVITFDGQVVLCCADFARQVVAGDLNEQSLEEIWNGPVLTDVRQKITAGRIDEIPLCRDCAMQ